MIATKTLRTEQRSIEHLNRPAKWANWPVQTVKKQGSYNATKDAFPWLLGCVIAINKDGIDLVSPVVYEVNLFFFSTTDLNTVPQHKYASVEEMVADGWVVD